jgi:hypothetical protein
MAESNHDPQATSRRPSPRNRASSLRQLAATLPSVDHALDELIARANQTELALGAEPLEPDALGADGLDAESLDVGLLEAELREAATREQALRHQLDDLRGRLADAETRPASATPAVARPRASTARSWPWLAAGGAFLGGLALMFAVTRLTSPAEPSSAAMQARDPMVMPRPMVTPIQVPTVTPIDPAVAPTVDPPAPAVDPSATAAPAPPAPAPPTVDPPAVAVPAGTGASRELVTKPRARPPAPPARASTPRGELADPFAEPAKPGDRPAPRKPPASGMIVNPF